MFIANELYTGLRYFIMKSNYTWPTLENEYIDTIADDLAIKKDTNYHRKIEIYHDTLVIGSFDYMAYAIKRKYNSSSSSIEITNSNLTNLNKVRFYKKTNNNLFDNTYTEYSLGDNEMVNVRFALYKDIFTWIPTDVYDDDQTWYYFTNNYNHYWDVTNKIGIMKKDKKTNNWPSIVDLENNKNYNLITLNIPINSYHYNVYLNDNLIYVVKNANNMDLYNFGGGSPFMSQQIEGIYKVSMDVNDQVNIEQDLNNEYINYNVYDI